MLSKDFPYHQMEKTEEAPTYRKFSKHTARKYLQQFSKTNLSSRIKMKLILNLELKKIESFSSAQTREYLCEFVFGFRNYFGFWPNFRARTDFSTLQISDSNGDQVGGNGYALIEVKRFFTLLLDFGFTRAHSAHENCEIFWNCNLSSETDIEWKNQSIARE